MAPLRELIRYIVLEYHDCLGLELPALGRRMAQAGDRAGAAKKAGAVLAINPQYAKAYIVLGITLLAQGKASEAEDSYRKAKGLSVRGASYSASGLSDLALYQGRLAYASVILQEAIQAGETNKLTTLAQTSSRRSSTAGISFSGATFRSIKSSSEAAKSACGA